METLPFAIMFYIHPLCKDGGLPNFGGTLQKAYYGRGKFAVKMTFTGRRMCPLLTLHANLHPRVFVIEYSEQTSPEKFHNTYCPLAQQLRFNLILKKMSMSAQRTAC
jgi:hypothetical protein